MQAAQVRATVSAVSAGKTARDDFLVRFWGVRGSIATPGPATARYGGNTSSIEVRCGNRLILLDAGTGMRYLGSALVAEAPLDRGLPQRVLNDSAQGLALCPRQLFGVTREICDLPQR